MTLKKAFLAMALAAILARCGGGASTADVSGLDLGSDSAGFDGTITDLTIDLAREAESTDDTTPDQIGEPAGDTAVDVSNEMAADIGDTGKESSSPDSEPDVDSDGQPEAPVDAFESTGADALLESIDAPDPADACAVDCDGKTCGDDGCGGSCGSCADHFACEAGTCVFVSWCGDGTCGDSEDCATCQADCSCTLPAMCFQAQCCSPTSCSEQGLLCGPLDDGCGTQLECGGCDDHYQCASGACVFQPWCGDGNCDRVLNEDCATCPGDCGCACGDACLGGTCTFTACDGKLCGNDGCGGSCGSCADHYACDAGACVYVPWCGDGTCDPDETCATCAGDCGCACGQDCLGGACTFTACDGKVCGADGCGGSCGSCADHHACEAGACVYVPWCGDGTCDPAETCESCATDCACACGQSCVGGTCTFTACDGKVCGSDGCGGSCGSCGVFPNSFCTAGGACDCAVDCAGRVCGTDGCGGSCGTCPETQDCNAAGACLDIPCTSDLQCVGHGLVCDPLTKVCVRCLTADDCGEGSFRCVESQCAEYDPCFSSLDCSGQVCDVNAGACVDCLADADCGANHVCRNATCLAVTPCASSLSCTNQVCNKTKGYCVDCIAAADCDANADCVDDACQPYVPCASDLTCTPLGMLCQKTLGRCVRCVADADCPGVYYCADNDCHLDQCIAGDGRCQGKIGSTCLPNGSGWGNAVTCGATEYCADGTCHAQVCTPSEISCEENVLSTCNGDGSAFATQTDCGVTAVCLGSACVPNVCVPAELSCDGSFAWKQCNVTGTAWGDTQECSAGRYCAAGMCVPQACLPNQSFCTAEGSLALCDAIGSGPSAVTPCPVDTTCLLDQCVPVICSPGQAQCLSGKVATCNDTGTDYVITECSATQYCADGTCHAQVCAPDAVFCESNTVMTCNADGSAKAAGTNCGDTSQFCVGGACKDKLCEASTRYCDGPTVMQCDATGTAASTVTTCLTGFFCDQDTGLGTAACAAWVCAPEALFCESTNVRQCDGVGSASVQVQDCADTSQVCVDGACKTQTCGDGHLDPSTEECDDNNQSSCDGCEACEERYYFATAKDQGAQRVDNGLIVTTFTVEFWLKTAVATRIVSHMVTGTWKGWAIQAGPDGVIFWINAGGTATTNVTFAQVGVFPAGSWHHVAVTYEGGVVKVFADGQLKASGNLTAFTAPTGAPFSVGAYNWSTDGASYQNASREIDEVRFSNVVRYDSLFTPARRLEPDANTMGLWHFDEGSGTAAKDASANGRDLSVLTGAGWKEDECYGVAPDATRCGDGKKAAWEACDDGDADNQDGCMDTCTIGPVTLTCGSTACPSLTGYTASCNAQQHCEYTNVDPTGWRQWDVWIWIPPGSFEMGSPNTEAGRKTDEGPVHTVTFANGFFIGKYEVTVSQHEACETTTRNGATCTSPTTASWDGLGWGTNRSSNGRSGHPQNGLTWAQAGTVCSWLGGRMPSEAEWEYAASGPTHRRYPWADPTTATCASNVAVFNERGDAVRPWACDPCTAAGCSGTSPVGTKPAGSSWSGALDVGGNVFEWVQDWHHDTYEGAPTDGTAWLWPTSDEHVSRGNGFTYGDESYLRVSARAHIPTDYRDAHFGVRCVRPNTSAPQPWSTVVFEDFSDNLAQGWTTGSSCMGCAGLGCPYVSAGVYQMKGDWNIVCLPTVNATAASKVAHQFVMNRTAKTHHWEIRADKSSAYKVYFDTLNGKVSFYQKIGSVETLLSSVDAAALKANGAHTNRVEFDILSDIVEVWIDGVYVGSGSNPTTAAEQNPGFSAVATSTTALDAWLDDYIIEVR